MGDGAFFMKEIYFWLNSALLAVTEWATQIGNVRSGSGAVYKWSTFDGNQKVSQGGIQKQPTQQEALSLDDCAETLRPTHPSWMLDLGTAWASSLTCEPGVGTRGPWNKAGCVLASRRGPTLARQATRRRKSTRLGPEQAAGAAAGVEGLGVEPRR